MWPPGPEAFDSRALGRRAGRNSTGCPRSGWAFAAAILVSQTKNWYLRSAVPTVLGSPLSSQTFSQTKLNGIIIKMAKK